jgi:hypothetical protein
MGSPFGEPNIRLRRQPKLVWKRLDICRYLGIQGECVEIVRIRHVQPEISNRRAKKTFHIPPQANKAITFF